ncbi:SDR family oxidoreductase [Kordiimonas sp. SCSIO 12610]|uniref:SDR family oxidoreductase n=1 Tax=Kordiimonas sp. SCSIO 12610 TaxID=2829597 RepID=UPI002109D0E9|nr:SDR family oxidoreductase [Kordiimonas sp. SCSIO 12610]UTW55511.1 SDR family oxidoreductase [Kordiimonas sp. SCSIO 12610]
MTIKKPHLLVFGPGYSAMPIMQHFLSLGWNVSASWRREEARTSLQQEGFNPIELDEAVTPQSQNIQDVTHILTSIAPKNGPDPILPILEKWRAHMPEISWIGYLSSTNVYGDHSGNWVDETTACSPSLERGKNRLLAENSWHDFSEQASATLHIFRLAGIYGPRRNAIRSLLSGKAKRIIKEGQVFSRIHVEDICQTVVEAATGNYPTNIFNLADDEACPPQDVITMAADLTNMPVPEAQDWETADLSPMARSFYLESKRVKNDKIKSTLGITLKYPSYRTGLQELLKTEL